MKRYEVNAQIMENCSFKPEVNKPYDKAKTIVEPQYTSFNVNAAASPMPQRAVSPTTKKSRTLVH